MVERFEGIPPELRPRPSCLLCTEERPCTWVCLGTDSVLAGAIWMAEEMLADFERAEAEAASVAFVVKGITDSF